MNRKLKKEIMPDDLSKKIGIYLSLPDSCTDCGEKFDKTSKEMRDTWVVAVYNAINKVILVCPDCAKKEGKKNDLPE